MEWRGARGVIVAAALVMALDSLALAAAKVGVLNAAGGGATRQKLAARTAELRGLAVAQGVGLKPPADLRAVLEGDIVPEPYRLDLAPVEEAAQRFDDARADLLLSEAESDALARAPEAELPADVAAIYFARGVLAANRGDRKAAIRAFQLVVRLDPQRTADEADLGPKVARAFATARKPARRGGLRMTVSPADASVVLDGTDLGGGAAAEIDAGLHLVVVARAGYRRQAAVVEVAARGTTIRDVTLAAEAHGETAVRLMEKLAGTPPGPGRLEPLRELAVVFPASRFLVVEDEGRVVALYDLEAGTVSAPVTLGEAGLSPDVAALLGIPSALAPPVADVAPPPETSWLPVPPADRRGRGRPPWYRRWGLWAAAGAAAVVVTGVVWSLEGDETPVFVCCGERP